MASALAWPEAVSAGSEEMRAAPACGLGSEGVGEGCPLGAHGVLVMLVSLVLLIYGTAEERTYHLFV
jgi:alkylation response protein AidB-like acyl-CoA dehydrogenase